MTEYYLEQIMHHLLRIKLAGFGIFLGVFTIHVVLQAYVIGILTHLPTEKYVKKIVEILEKETKNDPSR